MAMTSLELRALSWGAALQLRDAALARERPSPATRIAPLPGRRLGDPMGRVASGMPPRNQRRRLTSPTPYSGSVAAEPEMFATAGLPSVMPPAVGSVEPSAAGRARTPERAPGAAETTAGREARAEDTEH